MATQKKTSFKEDVITYFKGVKSEFFKIIWPEKRQVIVETVWVIGIVTVFTLAVLIIDTIFGGIFSNIR